MKRPIIAIDFDDTIVENAFPNIGTLKPGAKIVINSLYNQGCEVLIWTCRSTDEQYGENASIFAVKKFLDDNGIKYTAINTNSSIINFRSFPKIYADVYIDDRGINGIPDTWREIYQKLKLKFPNYLNPKVK